MGSFVPKGGVFDGPQVAYEPYAADYWGAGRHAVPAYPPTGPVVPMAIRQRRVGFQGLGVYPGPLPSAAPQPVAPASPVVEEQRRMELIGRGGTLFTPVFPCPITRAPFMEHTGERGGIFDSPNVPCDFDVAAQKSVPEAIRTLPLPAGATAIKPVPEDSPPMRRVLPEKRPLYQPSMMIAAAAPPTAAPAAPVALRRVDVAPVAGCGLGPDGIGYCR